MTVSHEMFKSRAIFDLEGPFTCLAITMPFTASERAIPFHISKIFNASSAVIPSGT
jgi:hypothetical protein